MAEYRLKSRWTSLENSFFLFVKWNLGSYGFYITSSSSYTTGFKHTSWLLQYLFDAGFSSTISCLKSRAWIVFISIILAFYSYQGLGFKLTPMNNKCPFSIFLTTFFITIISYLWVYSMWRKLLVKVIFHKK